MEQLSSHWTDCHSSLYLSIFRKSVEKVQVSLEFDKNNGYFTLRHMHIYGNVSLTVLRMRNVSDNTCRENQNTHFMPYKPPPPSKILLL